LEAITYSSKKKKRRVEFHKKKIEVTENQFKFKV
jgi:hypothetical protein